MVDAFRSGHVIDDEPVLSALGPVWRAELARLLPEVVRPGLPSPSDDPLRLFESVAQLVESLARARPLAVLLEDLQWADEMSVRLVAFLARRLPDAPVLIVATAREEEVEVAPMLRGVLEELGRAPSFSSLTLPPLSPLETTALVRALGQAGSDPATIDRLGSEIWAASEGNPFVAVEIMRAVHEGGAPEAATGLPQPDRVRHLVTGRLDRLADRPRQLVAAAAVIGCEFECPLLQRAAELGERETAEGLEELVRRRVLHGVGERFDFTHNRIREVAYGSLLGPRRALLHGRVARALEALHAEDLEPHSAAIGAHYRESHAWDRAWPYLRRAGAQAAARSAHREAVACYEQALDALDHLPADPGAVRHAIDLRFDLRSSLVTLAEHR